MSSLNTTDSFTLPNNSRCELWKEACCVRDPFSDANDIRFNKPYGRLANYSKYECAGNGADNPYKFLVVGSRNPIDCHLSTPFIIPNDTSNSIDNLSTCGNPKFLGYNRNGRFYDSIYGRQYPSA